MQDKIAGIIETNCPFVEQWDTSECAAKIIAALPEMVQPLVWHKGEDYDYTDVPGAQYGVDEGGTGWEWLEGEACVVRGLFATREEVIAAAQADYTRRILSAFGITGET